MRQIQKLPIFTAISPKAHVFWGLVVLIAVMVSSSGCKKQTTIEVPRAILQAKSATLDELLAIVNQYDKLQTLQDGRLKAQYTSKKKQDRLIDLVKYPKLPGLLLMKRPDSLYLVLREPALKSTLLNLSSTGDELRVWVPKRNTFYILKDSSKILISEELEEPLEIPIRASHIFEAIFPKAVSLQDPEIHISKLEDEDTYNKYYVLPVYRVGSSNILYPLREFRIERAGLTLSRQRIYDNAGHLVSEISYSEMSRIENYALPGKIHIERPLDGYALDLEFRNWKVGPDFKDGAFKLEPPSGAKVKHF